MPPVTEMMHPKGLSFATQRQVVIMREVRELTWPQIAAAVRDLSGQKPKARLCREYYQRFNRRQGRAVSGYPNCGRKPWKITLEVERYLLRRLKELRTQCICSSTTLQQDLATHLRVRISASAVRKVLTKHGYRWLPRSQKRKYDVEQKRRRVAFAKSVLNMSLGQVREKLSFAMDGVVLGIPPRDPTDRLNFCKHAETHMYRKPSESLAPELAGDDDFAKQLPLARALPMWGGCSAGGFAAVLFHRSKKCSVEEWVTAVNQGKLTKAIKALRPSRPRGPWYVLCDNEHFLSSQPSQAAHRRANVVLWHIPAHSPDLNPVERFWSWLRRKLRAMDLSDAVSGRPVLGKMAYKSRVRRVIMTQKAQTTAANIAKGLRKTCRAVVAARGAAVKG